MNQFLKTKEIKSISVDPDLYQAALAFTKYRGTTVSAAISLFLIDLLSGKIEIVEAFGVHQLRSADNEPKE